MAGTYENCPGSQHPPVPNTVQRRSRPGYSHDYLQGECPHCHTTQRVRESDMKVARHRTPGSTH